MLLLQSGLIGEQESFNAPGWFLSIIVLCYMLFYLLCYRFKDNVIALFGIMAIFSIVILYNNFSMPILNRFTARGFLSFYIGMLIYKLYCLESMRLKKHVGLVCLLVFSISYVIYSIHIPPNLVGNYQLIYSILVMPSLFASVLLIKPINHVFSNRVMLLVGDISLEIFLLHYVVMYGMKAFDALFCLGINFHSFKCFIAYIVLTLFVAVMYKKIGSRLYNSRCLGIVLNYYRGK